MRLILSVEETIIFYQYLLKLSFESVEAMIMQIREFDKSFKNNKALTEFVLELTENDINTCSALLQEMPLKHSYSIFNKLINQINKDIEKKKHEEMDKEKLKMRKRKTNKP